MTERINPDTGVKEELGLFGWRESNNESGNAERVNPDTGVAEERGLFGWRDRNKKAGSVEPKSNVDGARGGATYAFGSSDVGKGSSDTARLGRPKIEHKRTSPAAKVFRSLLIVGVVGGALYLGGKPQLSGHASNAESAKRTLAPRIAIYGDIAFAGGSKWLLSTDGFELRVTTTDTLSDIHIFQTARFQNNVGAGGPFLSTRDGRKLFAAGDGLALWDTFSWRLIYHTQYPITGSHLFDKFTGIGLSHDERTLFSGSIDCVSRSIDASNGRVIREVRIFTGRAFCGNAISAQAGLMVSFELEHGGTEIKFTTLPALSVVPGSITLSARVNSAKFNADGSVLALGLENGTVELWDTRSRNRQRSVAVGDSSVAGIAFLPSGKQIAVALMDDKNIKIIDTASGNTLQTLSVDNSLFAWTLAASPDGKWLAASGGKIVTLWNLEKLGWR